MPARDPLLIGLVGAAGAGKDTVAERLELVHGFYCYAFARPLREAVLALLDTAGVDHAWATERALKELPMPVLRVSYRHLAQSLGTEWGRAIAPDFWLRLAAGALGLHGTPDDQPVHDRIVVSDVRFANEASWVRVHGGVLVRVVREALAPVRAHVSEQYAHSADCACEHELDNRGSLAGLQARIDQLVEELVR